MVGSKMNIRFAPVDDSLLDNNCENWLRNIVSMSQKMLQTQGVVVPTLLFIIPDREAENYLSMGCVPFRPDSNFRTELSEYLRVNRAFASAFVTLAITGYVSSKSEIDNLIQNSKGKKSLFIALEKSQDRRYFFYPLISEEGVYSFGERFEPDEEIEDFAPFLTAKELS